MSDINLSLSVGDYEQYLVDIGECNILGRNGIRYIYRFPNGYGASVTKQYGSYGYFNDLWELAVILFEEETDVLELTEYMIVYPEPILHGQDVLANLTENDVIKVLEQIFNL